MRPYASYWDTPLSICLDQLDYPDGLLTISRKFN